MGSYLSAAGPLAWPAILLGIVGVAAAFFYALRPAGRPAAIARAATAASIVCALLNTLLGFQHSLSFLSEAPNPNPTMHLRWISESLSGLVAALALALLVSLLFLIGGLRRRDATGAG